MGNKRLFKDENYWKVFEKVFDQPTIDRLYKLEKEKYFEYIEGILSEGKEANVYLAKAKKKERAIKIYKIFTSSFHTMWKYIEGDPRFRNIKKSKASFIFLWTKKEYRNLRDANNAGVRVPFSFIALGNVLVMEYITYRGERAPLLGEIVLEKDLLKQYFEEVGYNMGLLYYKAKLVHADLSQYNILVSDSGPVFIDFSQAVSVLHPNALEFMKRDVRNIAKFFKKAGLDVNEEILLKQIKKAKEG